jgi:tripartite-type tricarboxylate transporter receptor subunit TctC
MRRMRIAWLGISISMLVALLSPAISNAAEGGDFYRGKTVRIVVPFPSGGEIDILSRILSRGLTKYVSGNPTVVVENKPGAGGAIALNQVFNVAAPDGLTILGISNTSIIDQLIQDKNVRFDLSKFEYLGNAGPILQALSTRVDSPLKTMGDFRGRSVAVAGGGSSSTSTLIGRILKQENFDVQITLGYQGDSDRYKALVSKEADAALLGSNHLTAHKSELRPVLWVHRKLKGTEEVPNLEELPLSVTTRSFIKAMTVPTQYGRAYVAPPGTPKTQLSLLRQGFQRAVADPEFIELAAKIGVDSEWASAEETRTAYVQVLGVSREAIGVLKALLGAK